MNEATEVMNQDVASDSPTWLPIKSKLAIAALGLFTIFITWRAGLLETTLEDERARPALVDQRAPDFAVTMLDGSRTVSLSDFRGHKKVVVSFWASWCGPCRMEMPGLVNFYKRNHTDSSDFEFLAVSIDESAKDATAFVTAQKMIFPVLLDSNQKMAQAFQVEGIPTTFVIDKEGKITYGHVGFDMTMDYWLARELGIKEKTREGQDGSASH